MENLDLKQLKELAREKGIEFAQTANRVTLLKKLREAGVTLEVTAEEANEVEVLVEEANEVEVLVEEAEELKQGKVEGNVETEEPKKKIYAGICLKTGEKLYL